MIPVGLAVPACRNKNNRSVEQASELLRSPGYKKLNDSIQQFPEDASLYLRRAIRLTQENAHEQAIADFQKTWSLQPSLENALPFAANLEILGKHQERLSLLESVNQRYPGNTQVNRLLADSYANLGMSAKALQIYNGQSQPCKRHMLYKVWTPMAWNWHISMQNKKIPGRWKYAISS